MGLRLPVHPLLLCREVRDREDELNLKKSINDKNDKDMKKTYITPEVEVIKVDVVNILAESVVIDSDKYVDTNEPGGQLGREDNTPSRPGIWEQGW